MGDEQRRLPHGAFVRLNFPLRDLLIPLCHEHPEEFAMCAKCGFIAEFFYKLHCAHYLCDRCIGSAGSFTCWKDGIRTEIQTPLTTTPTRNAQLIKAAMLCPGCSQPIMFKDIKAHINQQHSGLWKQENQRTKIDEKAAKNFGSSHKAYSGKQQPVPEQRPRQQRFQEFPPISEGYRQSNQHHEVESDFSGQRTNKRDDSANQKNYARDEFSKSPGMSFVTPVDIKEQSHVPLQAGYRGDAGTAGLGGYPQAHKVDDLQRDSLVQQAPRPDETTALSEPPEEEDMPQELETVNHDLHQKQIEQLHEEIRHLKEEKTAQEEKLNTATNRCSTLEQLVEKLRSDLKDIQTTIQELHLSEERNRRTIAKCEENLNNANNERSKLEDRLEKQSECHLLPVFQHTWKLQPYSALRKSLLFNNATLSTGVLSVNTPGYKIELMLSIRGDYREWRRQLLKDETNVSAPTPHLALMLRIHQGEHDDLLAWPFTNKISLLLVNHLNEEKSKLLELGPGDGDGDWLKKPVRASLNPMFGFSRVISLPDLENLDEGFLFQDCIVFKFTVHRRE